MTAAKKAATKKPAVKKAATKTDKIVAGLKTAAAVAGAVDGSAKTQAVVAAVDSVADMIAQLHAIRDRVARAPAHVVAAANIRNGMDPVEINNKVLAAMDAHGIE